MPTRVAGWTDNRSFLQCLKRTCFESSPTKNPSRPAITQNGDALRQVDKSFKYEVEICAMSIRRSHSSTKCLKYHKSDSSLLSQISCSRKA
eukprot:scaffold5479_cov199-Amphora_coffeaeformis.AAC.41